MSEGTKLAAFSFGAFGGVLPTLAHLASTYVSAPGTPMPELGMLLGLLLWALVGGGVALTNTVYEAKQAIFAGIAAPAILASVVAGVAEQKPRPQQATVFGIAAHAQEGAEMTPPDVKASGWAVILSPDVSGGMPRRVQIPVAAQVQGQNGIETVEIGKITDLTGNTAFSVPEGTEVIYVGGKPVDATGTLTNVGVSVRTSPTSGGDFLWALGAQRSYAIRDFSIHADGAER